MNQSHYPSLELCKRLTAIGFPTTELCRSAWTPENIVNAMQNKRPDIICPSVMEMLDITPDWIRDGDRIHPITSNPYRLNIYAGYGVVYSDHITCKVIDKSMEVLKPNTLPNALAEMILWLHENNYISFTK